MRTLTAIALSALSLLLVAGCSNITLTDDGSNVIVMKKLDVLSECNALGSVTTNSKNVNRTQEDKDREILARNESAKMGGNVVVAQGEPVDNAQEFAVYRCP
jgi:hypothetical protein